MSTLLHTRRRHAPTEVESNLTSMIDVVFLLVVFFILVSDLAIHLRADREVHFEWIHPVLEALRAASARVDGAEAKVHLVLLEPAS